MATLGLTPDQQTAVEAFRTEVVEPSMRELVLLYFTAEWCGPCKALGPVIQKVADNYAKKGVRLVKLDIDKNRFIAEQFQIKSVPTVYAMFEGRPVADLTNARSESQMSQMLDQLLRQLPVGGEMQQQATEIAPLLAMGEDVLASGDYERAVSVFAQIAEMAPDNADAQAGLARALIASGQVEAAEDILAGLPDDTNKAPAIERARAALTLAKDSPRADADALAPLAAAMRAAPDDHQAAFAYATAAIGAGERDGAADALLGIITADREWNEGAARTKLLNLFEVVGLEDPWVAATRRRLSAILFG